MCRPARDKQAEEQIHFHTSAWTKAMTMNKLTDTLRFLARAASVGVLVATPLLMVPKVNAGDRVIIEAPSQKKMGAGLVLLVSLQRA